MARKTIEVGKILRMVNTFLAAKHTSADERGAMCLFLEAVLFETGNYEGFCYLPDSDYPDEVNGLGDRRFYFASKTVLADEAEELRDVNKIRV